MPPVKEYEIGEWVSMENDIFFDGGSMVGYEVRVQEVELLSVEQYLEKYSIEYSQKEKEELYLPEKVYDIHVKVRNTNKNLSDESGMNFWPLVLQGREMYCDINDELYGKANPAAKGNISFALKPNTEMEFWLPFNLREEWFTKKVWKNIEQYPLSFVLTKYPNKKIVRLDN